MERPGCVKGVQYHSASTQVLEIGKILSNNLANFGPKQLAFASTILLYTSLPIFHKHNAHAAVWEPSMFPG